MPAGPTGARGKRAGHAVASSRPAAAWPAVAAVLAAGTLSVAWLGRSADGAGLLHRIDWQPSLAATEPWRAWTAAFVHWSHLHLAADLAGLLLVGALGVAARLPARAAGAWLLAWPLTQFGLLAQPSLAHYGGLSGVLHAGVAVAGVQLVLTTGRSGQRWLGAAIIGGLAVKIAGETPWSATLAHPPGWDIAVATGAHLSGVLAGALTGLALNTPPARRSADSRSAHLPMPNPTVRQQPVIDRKTRLDGIAIASLLCCCLLWGLNPVAAKVALAEITPLQQATVRSIGAALLVWAWSRGRGVPLFARDGTLPGGVLAGLLFGAEFACIFIGLQYTNASRMAVFIYLSPFVVAIGMPFIARSERLNAAQVAGLLLAFAGVAWAFAEGLVPAAPSTAAAPLQWLGDALGVGAAVLWGATTLAIRGSRLSNAAPEKTLFYQLAVSGAALLAAAVWQGTPWRSALSPLAAGSLVFQTVVVVFASYLLWFWLMRHYPATPLAVFTLLTPVCGLLLGALLLGEPVTPRLVVALAAVTAGIVLVNRRPSRSAGSVKP